MNPLRSPFWLWVVIKAVVIGGYAVWSSGRSINLSSRHRLERPAKTSIPFSSPTFFIRWMLKKS